MQHINQFGVARRDLEVHLRALRRKLDCASTSRERIERLEARIRSEELLLRRMLRYQEKLK